MVNLNGIICSVASTCIDYWQPEVKGPGLSSGGGGAFGGWVGGLTGEQIGWVERGDGGMGERGFYKSQCKSRDKYYLQFEERHSRYLLYRGKGPAMSGTQVRPGSKENVWR